VLGEADDFALHRFLFGGVRRGHGFPPPGHDAVLSAATAVSFVATRTACRSGIPVQKVIAHPVFLREGADLMFWRICHLHIWACPGGTTRSIRIDSALSSSVSAMPSRAGGASHGCGKARCLLQRANLLNGCLNASTNDIMPLAAKAALQLRSRTGLPKARSNCGTGVETEHFAHSSI